MVSAIAARIAKLESRRSESFMCVIVHGGLPGGIEHAVAGPTRWQRGKGEDLDGFVLRVKDAARTAGDRLLVVGGLP